MYGHSDGDIDTDRVDSEHSNINEQRIERTVSSTLYSAFSALYSNFSNGRRCQPSCVAAFIDVVDTPSSTVAITGRVHSWQHVSVHQLSPYYSFANSGIFDSLYADITSLTMSICQDRTWPSLPRLTYKKATTSVRCKIATVRTSADLFSVVADMLD